MSKIGVFSQSDLRELVNRGRIVPLPGFHEDHIGPASIDLGISGDHVYEIKEILKPSGRNSERVRDLLPYLVSGSVDDAKVLVGDVMYPGHTYLAKATVDINFPPGMYAFANAKSSSGRNFLLVRVIADGCEGFDAIDHRRNGYTGEVWFVLQPLSYPIILTNNERFIQMRVFDGDTRFTERDLQVELQRHDFLFRHNDEPYPQGGLSLFAEDGSIFTTLYAKAGKLVGFRAIPYDKSVHHDTLRALDLTARGLDPQNYFEPVYAEEDPSNREGGLIRLATLSHYLLSSNEKLKVPTTLSCELQMLDPRFGLFFSHFAGFFDPGFYGAPTLEVATLVATTLRHKEVVARFGLERMRSQTASYKDVGNYAGQRRTTLPKQFAMPPAWQAAMD